MENLAGTYVSLFGLAAVLFMLGLMSTDRVVNTIPRRRGSRAFGYACYFFAVVSIVGAAVVLFIEMLN